ncbi:plasmid mobilization protein [Spirosoma pollinicola]|uniref:Bacterial mobilisation domain-containing protein n=1 Tax=Spirosoma pollinicola TaxID=2057025 RepID=A0A2K8Z8T7_9BACT|nr:plasmid mobilization relaxosome protein MobC [Spirosoma pollinicola]AUD06264.1 hypothetical protein CWM47_33115 [Spirosoma pollinicola]
MKEKDKWYKGGRPEMKPEERATRVVQVRFTQAEYDQLLARKATVRTLTVSTYVRAVCLNKPLRLKPERSTYQNILLSLIQETRSDVLRIGVNINQAARRINSTTDYQDLQREVNKMASDMARFDAQLREVMGTILKDGGEV